jgi:molecular chaperone GrpE
MSETQTGEVNPDAKAGEIAGEVTTEPREALHSECLKEAESLRKSLEGAYRRVDELARAIQSGERDRESFKERLTRERERMLDVERGKVALTLLEAVDELDMCLGSSEESPLARGVRLIRDGMLQKLSTMGVDRVPLAGQTFDPNVAEAVDMEITPHAEEDQRVVKEVRPAYRMKERVIREGRVKVAKYVKPAEA